MVTENEGVARYGCLHTHIWIRKPYSNPRSYHSMRCGGRWVSLLLRTNCAGQLRRPSMDDMKSLTVGFGRRVCLSRRLADNPFYIDLPWSFCIGQRPESPINTQDSESVISNVTPFEIDVIPHGPCEVVRNEIAY
ncbi:uncharacterized protein F5891DRAFT_1053249 [Suillus fuscotomentosus]|uniref:Uncharacterized protein n=1 Tax=Suillus fuscotomentosus TaxID=1912939 RepID=A0AAD4DYR6_9AGAM|nr:uncharacterized protein F5891DRAFT_1053249 [Suillus fuscotomentosus]KAG1896575.1 hypothetical protein F5891DRAFT_1053249 [Suillus fuscotomentosus]